jgi:hypothetical protein
MGTTNRIFFRGREDGNDPFDSSQEGIRQGKHRHGREIIKAGPTAKLLGVVFDQEMRWKDHVQQAVKKATTTTLGMSGLRHLRPAQLRQIHQACVLPKLDYASTVWHNRRKDKGHLRVFGTVLRAALLRIISAF